LYHQRHALLQLSTKRHCCDGGLVGLNGKQLDFVTAMMDHFKANKVLDLENVLEILKRAKPLLAKLPNVVVVPVNTRITVRKRPINQSIDSLTCVMTAHFVTPMSMCCYRS
jgi:hypothetical protein